MRNLKLDYLEKCVLCRVAQLAFRENGVEILASSLHKVSFTLKYDHFNTSTADTDAILYVNEFDLGNHKDGMLNKMKQN